MWNVFGTHPQQSMAWFNKPGGYLANASDKAAFHQKCLQKNFRSGSLLPIVSMRQAPNPRPWSQLRCLVRLWRCYPDCRRIFLKRIVADLYWLNAAGMKIFDYFFAEFCISIENGTEIWDHGPRFISHLMPTGAFAKSLIYVDLRSYGDIQSLSFSCSLSVHFRIECLFNDFWTLIFCGYQVYVQFKLLVMP